VAKSSRGSSTSPHPDTTPPVFSPVVVPIPNEDFTITNSQFDQLEKAGDVKLSEQQRTNLATLANFWIDDLRIRRTARPKRFTECFDQMETAFLEAEEACRWDQAVKRLPGLFPAAAAGLMPNEADYANWLRGFPKVPTRLERFSARLTGLKSGEAATT
jgi:hypothetical protein